MTKLSQIVNGVSDSIKASFKEKRINKALDAAVLNAQESLELVKAKLEEYPVTAAEKDAETIVSDLAQLISSKKDAEYTLDILEEVKNYFAEDEVAE